MGVGRGAPSRRRWLEMHAVDLAFGAIVVATFAYLVRLTRFSWFWVDDWPVIRQSGSFGGWLEPYNGHLSVLLLGIYRVLVEVFGFAYNPVRVVGMVTLFSIPVAYYLTTRRQLGPPLAAFLALALLFVDETSLFPGELNHHLALLGGVGCAAALNRGPRADPWVAAALVLALCSAGGGVAVAAGCVAHNLLTRASLRRWIAVVVPGLAWGVWWLVQARDSSVSPGSASDAVAFAWDLAYRAFESFGFGVGPLAVLLLVAFVGYAAWRLSQGLDAAANVVAWSFALAVWGAGLAYSRGVLADAEAFRYRWVAMGFVLLAVVPRRPIRWPERYPLGPDRRWLAAAAAVILVVGAARGLAVRGDYQDFARQHADLGRIDRGQVLVLELGPDVVPDNTGLTFWFAFLNAGHVRELLDRYGAPFDVTMADADRRLVELDIVRVSPAGARPTPDCRPLAEPVEYQPGGLGVHLTSPDGTVPVEVRRFGDEWVQAGEVHEGRSVAVNLPSFESDLGWQVRADGACRVFPR